VGEEYTTDDFNVPGRGHGAHRPSDPSDPNYKAIRGQYERVDGAAEESPYALGASDNGETNHYSLGDSSDATLPRGKRVGPQGIKLQRDDRGQSKKDHIYSLGEAAQPVYALGKSGSVAALRAATEEGQAYLAVTTDDSKEEPTYGVNSAQQYHSSAALKGRTFSERLASVSQAKRGAAAADEGEDEAEPTYGVNSAQQYQSSATLKGRTFKERLASVTQGDKPSSLVVKSSAHAGEDQGEYLAVTEITAAGKPGMRGVPVSAPPLYTQPSRLRLQSKGGDEIKYVDVAEIVPGQAAVGRKSSQIDQVVYTTVVGQMAAEEHKEEKKKEKKG
jgi:hypothetical protein